MGDSPPFSPGQPGCSSWPTNFRQHRGQQQEQFQNENDENVPPNNQDVDQTPYPSQNDNTQIEEVPKHLRPDSGEDLRYGYEGEFDFMGSTSAIDMGAATQRGAFEVDDPILNQRVNFTHYITDRKIIFWRKEPIRIARLLLSNPYWHMDTELVHFVFKKQPPDGIQSQFWDICMSLYPPVVKRNGQWVPATREEAMAKSAKIESKYTDEELERRLEFTKSMYNRLWGLTKYQDKVKFKDWSPESPSEYWEPPSLELQKGEFDYWANRGDFENYLDLRRKYPDLEVEEVLQLMKCNPVWYNDREICELVDDIYSRHVSGTEKFPEELMDEMIIWDPRYINQINSDGTSFTKNGEYEFVIKENKITKGLTHDQMEYMVNLTDLLIEESEGGLDKTVTDGENNNFDTDFTPGPRWTMVPVESPVADDALLAFKPEDFQGPVPSPPRARTKRRLEDLRVDTNDPQAPKLSKIKLISLE